MDEQRTGPRIEGYDDGLVREFLDTLDAPGFSRLVGVELDLISPDRVEAHLDVRPEHLQPYGNVHGGVHATLVEGVGSLAAAARVAADGNGAVGLHNSTDFLRAVTGGRLDVVATPIHVGRTQHLWQVDISDERGRLVARGQLRMQVIVGVDGGADGPRPVTPGS